MAYEVCGKTLGERYTLEQCDVPARDEPNMIWVFGDPLVMGMLKEKWEPEKERLKQRNSHKKNKSPFCGLSNIAIEPGERTLQRVHTMLRLA